MATPVAINQLSLVPLGAGDLIDRAVRLYRRYFMTLIRIAAPPVVITTVGSLMLTVGWRSRSDASKLLLVVIGFLIQAGGILLNLIVIGGAARNLITHLLWNEPFSARTTYRNVRARFGSLLGAAIIIALWVFLAFFVAAFIWAIAIQLVYAAVLSANMGFSSPRFATAIGIMGILIVTFPALVFFFFMVKFIAYVPQVLMIEGRGVFDSIGRSFTLARGNLRRLMAMFLFYWFAAWSALTILLIPLFWYGYAQGINISLNKAQFWPTWFAIGYNVLTQMSTILLVPVLMLGLSLMYVDERVRQEGYDVELLAAKQLAMPNLYGSPNAPYRQATVRQSAVSPVSPSQYNRPGSTHGLR